MNQLKQAAVLVLAAATLLPACADRTPLERELEAGLERSVGSNTTFSAMTSFRWDHLHFFGPYTSSEHIQQRLGFSWVDPSIEELKTNDGVVLVVFAANHAVVRSVLLPRRIADPTGVGFEPTFLPTSRFHVERAGRPKYSVVPVYPGR